MAGGLGPRGIAWRRGHDHRHPPARLGTGAVPGTAVSVLILVLVLVLWWLRRSFARGRSERGAGGERPRQRAFTNKGRSALIDAAQVRAMKAQGLGASEIAKAFKIGRASLSGLGRRLIAAPLDGSPGGLLEYAAVFLRNRDSQIGL
jgi:hypothetical protein